ncbi:MAG TPA: DUF4136 domain-containing protein, partial [Ramlibacter sp.]
MSRLARTSLVLLMVAAGTLSGCASYRMNNTVQAFSGLQGLPANPTYRFERLPSQAAQPGQDQLEALADPVLHRAGLRRDDAAPQYGVTITATVNQSASPWPDPGFASLGLGIGGRGGGVGFGVGGPFFGMQQPWYMRQVGVLLRDIASGRVVFESHANSDGPWIDPQAAIPAMLDAALQGFPNPPPGLRQVDLNLGAPRTVSAAPAAAAPAVPATVAR